MNIEQIKQDLAAGVIVSPGTWRKLVEAALIQQEALKAIEDLTHNGKLPETVSFLARVKVEAL